MGKSKDIKSRNLLILLGIIVAILISISTQWAVAGSNLLDLEAF